jgi:hypothetical protein
MSLLYSAKINGHQPYAYLKDLLERLLTQRQRDRRAAAASLEASGLKHLTGLRGGVKVTSPGAH